MSLATQPRARLPGYFQAGVQKPNSTWGTPHRSVGTADPRASRERLALREGRVTVEGLKREVRARAPAPRRGRRLVRRCIDAGAPHWHPSGKDSRGLRLTQVPRIKISPESGLNSIHGLRTRWPLSCAQTTPPRRRAAVAWRYMRIQFSLFLQP